MKTLTCLLLLAGTAMAQQKPNWVTSKPFDAAYYAVINTYANELLDFNRQANFIEQRGQAFRKGYQVIHISTY